MDRGEILFRSSSCCAGRLSSDWFVAAPNVDVDHEEILVVGRLAEPDLGADATDSQKENPGRKELSFLARLGRLIGKFHVLVVHFPIALLLEAVLAELLSMWRKQRTPSSVVRFCVLLGAAGAVSAAGLGWLHAAFSAAGPRQILFIHRWLGTLAAAWSVETVLLSERDARSQRRSKTFRIVLFLGAGLIGLAAHFGGTLVFGLNYFKW